MAKVRDSIYVLGVGGQPDLIVYDRFKNQEILTVKNCSPKGTYTCLRLIQVNPEINLHWYLLAMKDTERLSLIAIDLERRLTQEM